MKVSIFDKNNSEIIIESNKFSKLSGSDEDVLDLTDELSEINTERNLLFIQECMNRVPKEMQTKENLELLSIVFDLKFKINKGE